MALLDVRALSGLFSSLQSVQASHSVNWCSTAVTEQRPGSRFLQT